METLRYLILGMRTNMKVTVEQLRRFVNEEVSRIDETLGSAGRQNEVFRLRVVGNLAEEMREQWMGMYDSADPSMAALGEAAWEEQVEQALESLETRILAEIVAVESELINGEFYSGPAGPAETSAYGYMR